MLAAGNRLGSDHQGLPTVQRTFETSGGAGLVVPELRLSIVCRLPKSEAAYLEARTTPKTDQCGYAQPAVHSAANRCKGCRN